MNLCCFFSGLLTTATLWLCGTCSSCCFLTATLWSCLLSSLLSGLLAALWSSFLSCLLAALWSCLLCSGLLAALWSCLLCGALCCFLLGCSHVFLLSAGSDPSPDLLQRMVPYIWKKFQHMRRKFCVVSHSIFFQLLCLHHFFSGQVHSERLTPPMNLFRAQFRPGFSVPGGHIHRFCCRTFGTWGGRQKLLRPRRCRGIHRRQLRHVTR